MKIEHKKPNLYNIDRGVLDFLLAPKKSRDVQVFPHLNFLTPHFTPLKIEEKIHYTAPTQSFKTPLFTLKIKNLGRPR